MRICAVVDRLENNKAVLLIADEEIEVIWPIEFLPVGVAEGDILSLEMGIDKEATSAARKEAEDLLQQVLQQNK